jgi:hypothetical protein
MAVQAAGGEILTTTRWQVQPVTLNDPGGRRAVSIACLPEKVEGVARLLNGLTLRDKDQDGKRITLAPRIQLTSNGLTCEFVDRDDTLYSILSQIIAQVSSRKAAAIIAFDPANMTPAP